MELEERDNERNSEGCERMAEMMGTFCRSGGVAIDCHFFMQKMMVAASNEDKAKESRRNVVRGGN